MKIKAKAETAVLMCFLFFVLLITLLPIAYTFCASFKTNSEILTSPGSFFPKKWSMENYVNALSSRDFNVLPLLRNSLLYTGCNVMINLFVSVTAGYVFARGDFPFKKTIFMCFTALMFIKTGGIDIYPTFQILNALHVRQSLWSLVLVNMFSIPIVNIYLVRSYISTLPHEIAEAAKIDGCGFSGILFKVYAPLLKPIMATIVILSFQGSWNEYLKPTFFTLTRPEQRTLIVGLMALKNSGASATSWDLMLAGSVIALMPVLFVYGFCNKFFVQGIAAGAVKG